jgi:hypothetical protein
MARARRLRICTRASVIGRPARMGIGSIVALGDTRKISLAELFTFLELLDFARPTRSPPPSYRDITHDCMTKLMTIHFFIDLLRRVTI